MDVGDFRKQNGRQTERSQMDYMLLKDLLYLVPEFRYLFLFIGAYKMFRKL